MILTDKDIELLKHIKNYASINMYHGLFPKREAAYYDEKSILKLISSGLIEEGSICTSCGNNLIGYKLSKKAEKELERYNIKSSDKDWEDFCCLDLDIHDCLEKEDVKALMDVYHLSHVSQFCGIAPKRLLLNTYDQTVINVLLDIGFINKIMLKGPTVKFKSGYVLSDKSTNLLHRIGYVR